MKPLVRRTIAAKPSAGGCGWPFGKSAITMCSISMTTRGDNGLRGSDREDGELQLGLRGVAFALIRPPS